ncbi:unnamed protein product, partial [Effrenium voratum]
LRRTDAEEVAWKQSKTQIPCDEGGRRPGASTAAHLALGLGVPEALAAAPRSPR